MPGGDGTGPAGMGPMTGRAAGYCAGYPVPGFMNPIAGQGSWGYGRGMRGGGRGRRNWFYATGMPGWVRAGYGYPAWGTYPGAGAPAMPMAAPQVGPWPQMSPQVGPWPQMSPQVGPWPQATKEQQIDTLKGQAEYFEDALDGIKKQIEELEAAKAEASA